MIRSSGFLLVRRSRRWRTLPALLILIMLLVGQPAAGQPAALQPGPTALSAAGFTPVDWSPDSRFVLASRAGATLTISPSSAQQLSELWLFSLDGAEPRRLSDNGVRPAFSPDGRELAYLAYAGDDLWAIARLDIASGAEERLPAQQWRAGLGPRWETDDALQTDAYADAAGLRYPSPDGRRVAVVEEGPGPSATLRITDQDSGQTRTYLDGERAFLSRLSWSPDGRQIAFSRTPPGTGNEGEICRLDVESGAVTRLTAGEGPLWSPDGRWLAYVRAGQVWLLPADSAPLPAEVPQEIDTTPLAAGAALATAQLTPPESIRVVHGETNTCRPDEPVGHIVTLAFEDYVKRVVPHEVWSTWPAEALKAQAVAARSYGWWWILRQTGATYDVSDTTARQYMCDDTVPSTDAAVNATVGQYVAYGGEVIFAEFSANNSSPTADGSYPYQHSVDDPVCFGDIVNGHGRGMSQWGAERWAESYLWTYEQILMHYYTGVTVERAANHAPEPAAPAGAVVAPYSSWYSGVNRLWLRANASDADGDLAGVDLYASWLDVAGHGRSQSIGAASRGSDGWYLLWDVSSVPDQAILEHTVVITGTARDAGGRSSALAGIRLGLDRGAPAGVVSAPAQVAAPAITLNVASSSDATSGVAGLLASNDWLWEGESSALGHEPGTGIVVSDTAALNGSAWRGRAGVDHAGAWYGPYTKALPVGQPYRALFRLKTDAITQTAEIARLDVVDNLGTRLLGLRRLRGSDFRQANAYQEFAVDFWYKEASQDGLEFRVAYYATGDLYYDRVLVTSYPLPVAPSVSWNLPADPGTRRIQVKLADRAGNVSADQVFTIQHVTPTPSPTGTPTRTPTITPTPTASRTATPAPSATPTARPTDTASIHLSVGAIFADWDSDGLRDAGEPNLSDVHMQFLSAEGQPMLPGVTAGSWSFMVDVPASRLYYLVLSRAGFQTRVERLIAPSAGATLEIPLITLDLRPWHSGALLPLVEP